MKAEGEAFQPNLALVEQPDSQQSLRMEEVDRSARGGYGIRLPAPQIHLEGGSRMSLHLTLNCLGTRALDWPESEAT